MKIAVASGKGGTGKTTIAVNLAAVLAAKGIETTYIDCDVEEPNGRIFLKPDMESSVDAMLACPVVDEDKCIKCGKCAEICRYKAIMILGDKPIVFEDMCHACGGCVHVCPTGAITETERKIGTLDKGSGRGIRFIQGELSIGQALSPPLIRTVKRSAPDDGVIIFDCPPGTSCPVVTAVQGCDFVVLVTEPTPFGLHDLKLAVEMAAALKIPSGVFINRADEESKTIERYCTDAGVPILGSLPDNRHVAETYSRGDILVDEMPELAGNFNALFVEILKRLK